MNAAQLAAYVARLVNAAPPLTDEQKARIRASISATRKADK